MFLLSIIGAIYLMGIVASLVASIVVIMLIFCTMNNYHEILDQIRISKMVIKYSFIWPFKTGPFIYKRIKRIKELRTTYHKGNK